MAWNDDGAGLAGIIRRRRSIREYGPGPITGDEVREIVELAGRAPSAWNLQPWRFVAVTDPEVKERLQAAAFGQPQVGRAPVVLVLYGDMVDALARIDSAIHPDTPEEARARIRQGIERFFAGLDAASRDQWGRAQVNIALGYLLLVLESRGYGSSPMLGFDPNAVRSLLGLPDHAEVAALVAFGTPAESGKASQRLDVHELFRRS